MRQKLKFIALFWGPSLYGGVFTSLLAIVMLGVANFSYVLRSGLLFDFLFGKGSPYDLIQTSKDTATAFNQTILGNPILNKMLFFGFWMMVGLAVYAFISTVGQTLAETGGELEHLHYLHARRKQIEQDLLLRIALRVIGLLALLLLAWLFTRFLFPFCIFASRVWLGSLSEPTSWLYLVLSVSVMLVVLHSFVIALRLVVLRPRIFGGWDSIG